MRKFFFDLMADLKSTVMLDGLITGLAVFLVYGMLAMHPTTAFDFAAARGSSFQTFFSYFFMHRPGIAIVATLFSDFSPLWNCGIGLVFFYLSVVLMRVLFGRLGLNRFESLLGALVWLSTPFFFCLSIYQHAMPSFPIALCEDALVLLCYNELLQKGQLKRSLWALSIICMMLSIGTYQAHANLLLTAMMGILALHRPDSWRTLFRGLMMAAAMLGLGVLAWVVVGHGPMILAKLCGVVIPKSGGAHDDIIWLMGSHSFWVNVKALLVGLLLNWGYNAFFIVGLRWVLFSLLLCFCLAGALTFRRQRIPAVAILLFALSVFAFPVLQGTAANLRTHFCLVPLITFSALLLLHATRGMRGMRIMAWFLVGLMAFSMGHETATLYYYNWKVKEQDKIHFTRIAQDYWRLYGFNSSKPVAIVGGWEQYPTVWEDMRPFRELPLVNHPFTTISNVSEYNVPREFYMVAREKVGLVFQMPEAQMYEKIKADKQITDSMPAYPADGYIMELDGVVVINLGDRAPWRRFEYQYYQSPNEKLLLKAVGAYGFDAWLMRATKRLRSLAEKYPWSITLL